MSVFYWRNCKRIVLGGGYMLFEIQSRVTERRTWCGVEYRILVILVINQLDAQNPIL